MNADKTGEYLDFDFDIPFDLMGDAVGVGTIDFNHYSPCDFLIDYLRSVYQSSHHYQQSYLRSENEVR